MGKNCEEVEIVCDNRWKDEISRFVRLSGPLCPCGVPLDEASTWAISNSNSLNCVCLPRIPTVTCTFCKSSKTWPLSLFYHPNFSP